MAEDKTVTEKRASFMVTFARLKDLVREMEDNERRLGQDPGGAEVELKLGPGELAWYVAYKTAAASVESPVTAVQPKQC